MVNLVGTSNIPSKSVIFCEKFTEDAEGIGMNWHWTKPIKNYFTKINYELTKETLKDIYYDNVVKYFSQ